MKSVFEKSWNIPLFKKAEKALKNFSLTEKAIFSVFATLLVISSIYFLWKINDHFLVEVPKRGGNLTEGVMGSPRFVNPLLADSDVDRSLSALVFSGLLRVSPEGEIKNDLAESFYVSEDGLTYSFILKEEIYFHDNHPITTEDVSYTIEKIRDPLLRSPEREVWGNIEEIEVLGSREINFRIKQPYAPFIYNFSIGIVPKHIFENFSLEQIPAASVLNEKPIGSGPFKIKKVNKSRRTKGLPESYTLAPWSKYPLGEPYIKNLIIKFYPDEQTLNSAVVKREVMSASGISPSLANELEKRGEKLKTAPMARGLGIFLNQDRNLVLRERGVREALDAAIDKEKMVQEILWGYGYPGFGPIPPQSTENSLSSEKISNESDPQEILENAGWWLNEETGFREKKIDEEIIPLRISMHTVENPELEKVAEKVSERWREIGVDTEVITIDSHSSFIQNIVRPREFETVLFGSVVRRGIDFYPLWHSTQTGNTGLNFTNYSNPTVDEILEKLRLELYKDKEDELYISLSEEITREKPKIFLYWPQFLYILPQKIEGVEIGQIDRPEDRFSNIFEWYLKTEKVWKIFAK